VDTVKIAIDVDDVLLKFVERFLDVCNAKYGTNFTEDEVDNFSFYEIWGMNLDDAMKIFAPIQENADVLNVIDMKCADYIQKLKSDGRDIDILTVRVESAREPLIKKLDALGIKQGSHYDNLIFAPFKVKGVKITHYDYDIYIDDNPDLVKFINGESKKILLLYDQPWNRSVICSGKNIYRVMNWHEVYNKVVEINKKNKVEC
jgi:uncharacterized HAD superfamily protein